MDAELSEQFYRIQAIDRALRIPSVNYLWDKSTAVYGKVKGVNTFTNWAFDRIETVLHTVLEKSLPVARFMEKPIYNLDKTFCQGLDFVEVKLPIIKEDPKQILDRTKSLVSERLRPAVQIFIDLKQETKQRVRIITLHTYYKAHYLRVYSWQQADKVMSTETGINILKTVDNTTGLAELMLDKYLPALEDETCSDSEDECSEHVKLHHTIVRLSEFSSRASRRIYVALTERLQYMYKIEILILILHALIVIQAIKFLETIVTSVLKFTFRF
ncbi:lipid storage droplets surface-binding protein 2 isoform X2 [Diachasma alloeum]|uniref:lipid storage droplets surface-binding protein 2 isoform X1 n=1 Tax=Diachasma alloeum TaxID=454923 RepID=UPI0007383FC7|nr:lipid storage droplets surface-binding protein 2 isoform X1 [Diachasma alloeum]XP_015127853.1 lipid storage droplets surface-binding protein 2 isoform X2 [Diachasma alloeum]